jgi:protein disulfide-isomerase
MHTCFRNALITILACCGTLLPVRAAEQWETNYSAALEQAAKQNKMVLLDFTGSDWCGWCIKLQKDTFSKPEFQKFAAESLILVELDFPSPRAAKRRVEETKRRAR